MAANLWFSEANLLDGMVRRYGALNCYTYSGWSQSMYGHFQQYTSVRLSDEYRGVLTEEGIRLGMLMIDNRLSMPVPVLELVHYRAGLHYTDEWKDLSLLAPKKDERTKGSDPTV